MITATFDANELKNVVSIFKSLYNEVNFVFTRDQLHITIIDTSKMCAFNSSLTPKSYDNTDDELRVFGILLIHLYTFLRSSKHGEKIKFLLDHETQTLDLLSITEDKTRADIVTKKCTLHNIIIPVVNMTIPYNSYAAKANVSYTTLHSIISAISAFSNTFVLDIDQRKMIISSGRQQSDTISYMMLQEIEWKEHQLDNENHNLLFEYEIKYMNNFLKKKITDSMVVRITNDGTLLVQSIWDTNDFVLLLSPILVN